MDPLERLRSKLPSLTKAESIVATSILERPSAVVGTSLTRFARDASSSNTAVIRLCQKLGYDGYAEFKYAMARFLLTRGARETAETGDPVQKLSDAYASYIGQLPTVLDRDRTREAARAIIGAGRLVIWGAHRCAESATHLSNRLMRFGIFNRVTLDPLMMADEANALGAGDVCILLTVNGSASPDYAADIDAVRRRGGVVILVTMDRRSDLVRHADISIELPWISREHATGLFEDQIIVLVFIEILLYEVGGERG